MVTLKYIIANANDIHKLDDVALFNELLMQQLIKQRHIIQDMLLLFVFYI